MNEQTTTRIYDYKETDFDRLINKFRRSNIFFLNGDKFKEWIQLLDKKTNGKYNLTESNMAFTEIRGYLAHVLNSCSYSDRRMPQEDVVEPLLKAAYFLEKNNTFLSKEEAILVMLVSILRIHCAVVYSRDVILGDEDKKKFCDIIVGRIQSFDTNKFQLIIMD